MRQGAEGDPDFKEWFRDYYGDILLGPAVPHVQVQLFDAGHAPFLEVPEAFNEAAAAFLAGLP